MPIPLPDGRTALRTVLIERKTGREYVLFERSGKYCHFVTDIEHGEYIIVLRVDWRDLLDSEPALDADIYRRNSDGQKGKRIPNVEWHHTRLEHCGAEDLRAYSVRFKDLELELVARKTLSLSASLSAYIVNEEGSPL